MTEWIQKHDFSPKELGTLVESEALEALYRKTRAVNSCGEGISPRTTEAIIHSHFLSAHERTREMFLEA